jgi:hypothetical protein
MAGRKLTHIDLGGAARSSGTLQIRVLSSLTVSFSLRMVGQGGDRTAPMWCTAPTAMTPVYSQEWSMPRIMRIVSIRASFQSLKLTGRNSVNICVEAATQKSAAAAK